MLTSLYNYFFGPKQPENELKIQVWQKKETFPERLFQRKTALALSSATLLSGACTAFFGKRETLGKVIMVVGKEGMKYALTAQSSNFSNVKMVTHGIWGGLNYMISSVYFSTVLSHSEQNLSILGTLYSLTMRTTYCAYASMLTTGRWNPTNSFNQALSGLVSSQTVSHLRVATDNPRLITIQEIALGYVSSAVQSFTKMVLERDFKKIKKIPMRAIEGAVDGGIDGLARVLARQKPVQRSITPSPAPSNSQQKDRELQSEKDYLLREQEAIKAEQAELEVKKQEYDNFVKKVTRDLMGLFSDGWYDRKCHERRDDPQKTIDAALEGKRIVLRDKEKGWPKELTTRQYTPVPNPQAEIDAHNQRVQAYNERVRAYNQAVSNQNLNPPQPSNSPQNPDFPHNQPLPPNSEDDDEGDKEAPIQNQHRLSPQPSQERDQSLNLGGLKLRFVQVEDTNLFVYSPPDRQLAPLSKQHRLSPQLSQQPDESPLFDSKSEIGQKKQLEPIKSVLAKKQKGLEKQLAKVQRAIEKCHYKDSKRKQRLLKQEERLINLLSKSNQIEKGN